MTKEQLIEEATKRGIVPGATIRQLGGVSTGQVFTVGPYGEWTLLNNDTELAVGSFRTTTGWWNIFAYASDKGWAEVISTGLQHGDYVAPNESKTLFTAIIEQAALKNIPTVHYYDEKDALLVYVNDKESGLTVSVAHPESLIGKKAIRLLSPGDFLNKLAVTDPYAPRTLTIEDRQVTFTKGYVTVGAVVFSNEAINTIFKNTFQ